MYQSDMYETTQKESFEFWRTMAKHHKGNNTVAFFELFNEPTTYNGQLIFHVFCLSRRNPNFKSNIPLIAHPFLIPMLQNRFFYRHRNGLIGNHHTNQAEHNLLYDPFALIS